MDEEILTAAKVLLKEIENLADSHRNITMSDFINCPQVRALRESLGLPSIL